MNDRQQDEVLLIDYVLGRCDADQAEAVRRRLGSDGAFSKLHANIANAMGALGAYTVPEPPEHLLGRTMARIRSARQTESLLAAEVVERPTRMSLFSFRELAALAAMVLLALGILVPTLRQAQRQVRVDLCANNARMIHTAMSHYASGNEDMLPGPSAGGESWLPSPGQPCASNSAGLFRLVREDYASPDVFQCPAAGGRPFVVEAAMTDFPSASSIGYSFQYSIKGPIRRSHPSLLAVAEQMVILADANPVFTHGRFRRDRVHSRVSDNHGGAGQNVLYLDGSVKWVTHAQVGVRGNNIWLAEGIYEYVGRESPASVTDTFLLPQSGR